jgi:hypothetical protein
MLINDATAHCSTSASLHLPTKPRITRGQHVHQRCHRALLHQLFSPPSNQTVSHEGNMSINDATAYCFASSLSPLTIKAVSREGNVFINDATV